MFRHLANDQARPESIAAEVRDAVGQGRKVLVLTVRTEHPDSIKATLDGLEPARSDKKNPQPRTVGVLLLVEAAGIEPASASPTFPDLHA